MAYDYQDLYRTNRNVFNGANAKVTFDTNQTLLLPADPDYVNSGNFAPLPNPNYGRPVVLTKPGRNTIDEQRQSIRFTGFVKYDFEDSLNSDRISKILGNHTLTILADENTYDERRINWVTNSFGDPDPALHIGAANARQTTNNVRNVPNLVYIGPPQLGAFSDSNWSLSDFTLYPAYYNLSSPIDKTFDKLSWNRGPDSTPETLAEDADVSNGNEQWLVHKFTPMEVPSKNYRLQQTTVTSMAANTQSSMFENHLIVNLGYREDTVENWLNTEANLLGVDEIADLRPGYWRLEDGNFAKNKSSIFGYGGVLYWPKKLVELPKMFDDITFHYNESENFVPATDRVDELRKPVASPTGLSKDWGVSLYMFENKFVARINWYDATLAGATAPTSDSYNQNITGMFNHWGNLNSNIQMLDADNDGVIDQRYRDEIADDFDPNTGLNSAGETIDEFLANEWPFLEKAKAARASVAPFLTDELKTAYNFRLQPDGGVNTQWAGQITDTQDIQAKGMEAEFIFNPTKSWRIAFNAARQETVLTNFAPRLSKLVEEFWAPHLAEFGDLDWNLPVGVVAGATTYENRDEHLLNFFALKGNEGKPNGEQREWRFNLITNYQFREGRLKGFSLGGAARWQDRYNAGYPIYTDPEYGLILPDVANPYLAATDLAIDLNFGYRKKIFDNVDWRMQINMRNVDNWDNRDIDVVRIQPDGSAARVRYAPPRELLLTNTFRF